jgi:hypothetical protein
MKLPFLDSNFVRRLRETASENVGKYGANNAWLESLAAGRMYMHESEQVVGPPPALEFSGENNPQYDA